MILPKDELHPTDWRAGAMVACTVDLGDKGSLRESYSVRRWARKISSSMQHCARDIRYCMSSALVGHRAPRKLEYPGFGWRLS